MRDLERKIAEKFGVLERCERLEAQLLSLPECSSVELDLSGFYDDMNQIILLIGYDIDVRREEYFEAMAEFKREIINVLRIYKLYPSGDGIEDYGKHLYFVRRCGVAWKRNRERKENQHDI